LVAGLFLGVMLESEDLDIALLRITLPIIVMATTLVFVRIDGHSRRAGGALIYLGGFTMIVNRALASPDFLTPFIFLPIYMAAAVLFLGPKRGIKVSIVVSALIAASYLVSVYYQPFPILFPGDPGLALLPVPLLMLALLVVVTRLVNALVREASLANRVLTQHLENYRHLFSVVVHDMANLTTVIGLSAEANRAERMTSAIHQMEDLISAVRQLRAGDFETEPSKTAVKLGDAIDTCRFVFENHLEAKGVEMTVETPQEEMPRIWTSGPIFTHVILNNLVSNAIKFSHPGGTIRIRVRTKDGSGVLEVLDEGTGLPEGVLEALAAGTNIRSRLGTSGETGTGRGLTNARSVAHRLGLKLEFSGNHPRGTVARVWCPMADPESQRHLEAFPAP